jgi:hypothetical protein
LVDISIDHDYFVLKSSDNKIIASFGKIAGIHLDDPNHSEEEEEEEEEKENDEEKKKNTRFVSSTLVTCELKNIKTNLSKDVFVRLRYRMEKLQPLIEYSMSVRDPESGSKSTELRQMNLCAYLKIENKARANFEGAMVRFVHSTIDTIREHQVVQEAPMHERTMTKSKKVTAVLNRSMVEDTTESMQMNYPPPSDSIHTSDDLVSYHLGEKVDIESTSKNNQFVLFCEDDIPCTLKHVFDTNWGSEASTYLVLTWFNKNTLLPPGIYRVLGERGDIMGDVCMSSLRMGSEYQLKLGKATNLIVGRKFLMKKDDEEIAKRSKRRYQHSTFQVEVHNIKKDRSVHFNFVEHLSSEDDSIRVDGIESNLPKNDAATAVKIEFQKRKTVPNTQEPDYTTYFFELELKPEEKVSITYVISTPLY